MRMLLPAFFMLLSLGVQANPCSTPSPWYLEAGQESNILISDKALLHVRVCHDDNGVGGTGNNMVDVKTKTGKSILFMESCMDVITQSIVIANNTKGVSTGFYCVVAKPK